VASRPYRIVQGLIPQDRGFPMRDGMGGRSTSCYFSEDGEAPVMTASYASGERSIRIMRYGLACYQQSVSVAVGDRLYGVGSRYVWCPVFS
jgi:hypothetical protein